MEGVCVFDIDQTLTCKETCSLEQIEWIARSIELCKENNMGIAINTARPPQPDILFGIDSKIFNLVKDVPVYSRPAEDYYVEERKLSNMNLIANKFNVDVGKTILIDDLQSTCQLLEIQDPPIPNIHVTEESGITEREYEALKLKLSQL